MSNGTFCTGCDHRDIRIKKLEAQLAWIKENHPQIYLMATQKQENEDE